MTHIAYLFFSFFHMTHIAHPSIVGSFKLYMSFAKEPYKRDYILQKRPINFLLVRTLRTPFEYTAYEVATISGLLKIKGLFCRIQSR